MSAYYNENDPAAAHALRELVRLGVIAPGDVDDRSIKDVQPDDLRAYRQCHFFAGGGLWSVAARMAGWPDDKPLWTASCPCQPFSSAGRGLGTDDPRHLWPDLHRLVRARRPPRLVGEQVARKAGLGWFDGISADLESDDYACRTVVVPACTVDAPHERSRQWWIAVADRDSSRQLQRERDDGNVTGRLGDSDARSHLVDAESLGRREGWSEYDLRGGRYAAPDPDGKRVLAIAEPRGRERRDTDGRGPSSALSSAYGLLADGEGKQWRPRKREGDGREHNRRKPRDGHVGHGDRPRREERQRDDIRGAGRGEQGRAISQPDRPLRARNGSWWAGAEWLACRDGKARRAEPGICLLADGFPGRVDSWRLAGNAIVPVLAAEVLGALLDIEGDLA